MKSPHKNLTPKIDAFKSLSCREISHDKMTSHYWHRLSRAKVAVRPPRAKNDGKGDWPTGTTQAPAAMIRLAALAILLVSYFSVTFSAQAVGGSAGMPDFRQEADTHDLNLPAWGPYSKRYAGISHIPDLKSGLRFDVSVLPGYYRAGVLIPNVLFDSGYFPWEANSDMKRFAYRYELEWKDTVYADVTYSIVNSNTVLATMDCVNNSSLAQNLVLNVVAAVDYPETFPALNSQLPARTQWVNAVDYDQLVFGQPRPDDGLVFDGWRRGEARSVDYLDGSAVARDFGKLAGDTATYTLQFPEAVKQGTLSIRYRMKENTRAVFKLHGLVNKRVTFTGNGQFQIRQVPAPGMAKGSQPLVFESTGGAGMEFNGFFFGPAETAGQIRLTPTQKRFAPDIITEGGPGSAILKYDDADTFYGLAWDFSPYVVRKYLNDELDIFFRKNLQNHYSTKFTGNEKGHFTDIFLRPIALEPKSAKTVHALICNGTLAEVKRQIASYRAAPASVATNAAPAETPFANALPEGEKYIFSQKMMRACVLSDVVYPIYTEGSYIRHFTPGKCWNSLYTWDSGFIALGLAEINLNLSAQCLNAYTTPPGSQSAFIFHGSPVPVQLYAFFELWNKTQSQELRAYFYPRLKQYYEFMAGRSGGSTTRALSSNLLKTWDYFYNSGGWDDYPPQGAVHELHLEKTVTPVITTAQCIRCAKMLRMTAEALALTNDVAAYDRDIQVFSDALQTYSWDAQSGYFSYVVHDQTGKPARYFTDSQSGRNFDMGLDGAYPLLAGICNSGQQDILLGKIFSPTNMWTRYGIGVVDQSAPYYRKDGYWNGTVWMPHQWFMWKTMLDLGRADLAAKIAHTALEVWKTETDASYHTFEHFLAETGRGAGWHQFSALSTPVLGWFSAYYEPGTVTTGFEIAIMSQSFSAAKTRYEAELVFDTATVAHERSMLVCLNPASDYEASFEGMKLEVASPCKGFIEIQLPATNRGGKLLVTPAGTQGVPKAAPK